MQTQNKQEKFQAEAQRLQDLRDSYRRFVQSGQKPNVPFRFSQLKEQKQIKCSKCGREQPKSNFSSEELRNHKDQASLCRNAKIYCQSCETPRFWNRRQKKVGKTA
jgi:hypothetical protein